MTRGGDSVKKLNVVLVVTVAMLFVPVAFACDQGDVSVMSSDYKVPPSNEGE